MKKSNWYVITGGPGSGKTTTIELLKEKGFTTTHETARVYFQQEIKKGITNEEIRKDPQKLQHTILKMQIALESQYTHNQLLFLDRAIPDSFGYFAFRKLPLTPLLINSKHQHYRKVFFLDLLSVKKDKIRIETDSEAETIAQYTYQAYKDVGIEIIRVPVMSKKNRRDFILDHIK
jgi:predicted ATPase